MTRGARKEPIFKADAHCLLFFEILEAAIDRHGIEVHAYALMPNHYHLLVRSVRGALSKCMQEVNGRYTQRVNRIHHWDGPLFRGRFRSQAVEEEEYVRRLVAYLHLNPVRAKLVKEPQEECWTSHRAYVGEDRPPPWLTREAVLESFGGAKALHAEVMAYHLGRLGWPEGMDLETGWFRVPGGGAHSDRKGDRARRAVRRPTDVMMDVFRISGAGPKDLRRVERGSGANPVRRFAVAALHRWTDLTHPQIASMVGMSRFQVANLICGFKKRVHSPIAEWLDELGEPPHV
jgi:REP element-mobilizing transposase RayT